MQKFLFTLGLSRGTAGGVGCIVRQVFQHVQTAAAFSTCVSCRARGLVHVDGEFKVCNKFLSCCDSYLPISFIPSNIFEDRSSAFVIYFALGLCTYFCTFSNKGIKILFIMKYSYSKKYRKCNKHALAQKNTNTTMLQCK